MKRRLGGRPLEDDAARLRTWTGTSSGGAGPAPEDAQYLTLAVDADLTAERVFTPGDGVVGTDGGAGGTYTLAVDLVTAWSGLEFSGGDLRVDLDAAFTWTAAHTFNAGATVAAGQSLNFGADVALSRSAANVLLLAAGDCFHADAAKFGTGVTIGSTATAAADGELLFIQSSADAQIRFYVDVADRWTLGVDQNDTYAFKIDTGGALGGSPALCFTTDGQIGIYEASPAAWLHVHQYEDAAGVAVLRLDQDDIDRPMIDFVGTSQAVAPLNYSLADEGDIGAAVRAAWVQCYLVDNEERITDGKYWLALYTLA